MNAITIRSKVISITLSLNPGSVGAGLWVQLARTKRFASDYLLALSD